MNVEHCRAANAARKFGRGAAHGRRRVGQCARRLALVTTMLLAGAALTAASAAADPISKIEINGAAPNGNGSGLQVTATWRKGGPQLLKVTNNSSSYTDIKEIDGAANPTPDPITDANRTDSQQFCNVDRTGSGSFSCPGLSIAPGQSVGIFLTSGGPFAQPTAGLAFINVIYDSIEVNGSPMNPHGKGLQVSAITTKGSCPGLSATAAWCLTVTNSPSSGAPMMLVSITPNSPPPADPAGQIADIHGEFGFGSNDGGCGANGSAGTAFFRFTAKGTTKFVCELMRNGQRKFYNGCTSPTSYAHGLPKGHYVFIVAGTNQGGVDRNPARFKFSL